jgi:hypothetical protein
VGRDYGILPTIALIMSADFLIQILKHNKKSADLKRLS